MLRAIKDKGTCCAGRQLCCEILELEEFSLSQGPVEKSEGVRIFHPRDRNCSRYPLRVLFLFFFCSSEPPSFFMSSSHFNLQITALSLALSKFIGTLELLLHLAPSSWLFLSFFFLCFLFPLIFFPPVFSSGSVHSAIALLYVCSAPSMHLYCWSAAKALHSAL